VKYIEKLRNSGLRPTKQRLQICEVLFNRDKTFHFTINELEQRIKKHTDNKDFFSDKNNIDFGDTKIYYQNIDSNPKDLKNNSDSVKLRIDSGIIILTCVSDNKVSIVTSITNDLFERYDSNIILKKVVNFLDGKGGGGRKDLAQGGAPLSKKFYQLKDSIGEIIS